MHSLTGANTRRGSRPNPRGARFLSIHTFRSLRDPGLFYIHSRWTGEEAFDVHATLPHTVRFLERADALVDQPREVTRAELMG